MLNDSLHDVRTNNPAAHEVKVLFVEDHTDFRQGMSEYLRLRGMKVTESASGIEFYAALRRGAYDVAVLDINLPDTTGFDLAAELSTQENIGIILLTARKDREDRLRGYGEGAHLYFTKPVDSEELALAIENLARRSRQNAYSSAREIRNSLRLDRARQTLHTSDGRFIKLSIRELLLLEYLASRPTNTASRDQIAKLFGDNEPDPESRALDATLSRLRAKFRVSNIVPPIQIIKRSGVRLIAGISVE